MATPSTSGIQTSRDGQSFIPASQRADGSTRKEIKVRPGYRPPEDVERYKSRTAEVFRSKGGRGVPGAEEVASSEAQDVKSKNARRREAGRKRKEEEAQNATTQESDLEKSLSNLNVNGHTAKQPEPDENVKETEADAEKQKKIRNHLKKLRAVHELKTKKISGEKLTAEQLVKIGKEQEIVQDLIKLGYDGPELSAQRTEPG